MSNNWWLICRQKPAAEGDGHLHPAGAVGHESAGHLRHQRARSRWNQRQQHSFQLRRFPVDCRVGETEHSAADDPLQRGEGSAGALCRRLRHDESADVQGSLRHHHRLCRRAHLPQQCPPGRCQFLSGQSVDICSLRYHLGNWLIYHFNEFFDFFNFCFNFFLNFDLKFF